jgi:hypothetical protein
MRPLRPHGREAVDEETMTDSAGAGADTRRPKNQTPFPKIRRVTMGAPLRWIAAGWRDFA